MSPRNQTSTESAWQREQRQQKLADLHERLTAEVEKLAQGDQWRRWLATAARFHHYSFRNTVLIWSQSPEATLVAGYRTWQELGRRVRRGERGIRIFAPVKRRPSADEDTSTSDPANPPAPAGIVDQRPEATAEAAGQPRRIVGVRLAYVFDVSQTDGKPLSLPPAPSLLSGQAPAGLWDALADLVASRGYTLHRGDCEGANGFTDSVARTVRVRADVDDAQAVKTLIHEVAHVLMHADQDGIRPECRGTREVEAESVAYLVAAHHGLDTAGFSFDYVTSWAHETSGQPADAVRDTGHRVLATAQRIIQHTDAVLTVPPATPGALLAATHDQSQVRAGRRRASARPSRPPGPAPAATRPGRLRR